MTVDALTVLDVLARGTEEPAWESLPALWEAYAEQRAKGCSPFSAAAQVAARADRLGQAFAVGYPAALEHLFPGSTLPAALCVTEAGGNRPSAIETQLVRVGPGFRLDGAKTFVTFGTLAKTLIVAARVGDKPDGRPDLVVASVPSDREGVIVQELPATSFVPEVPHAVVRFEGAAVHADELLPGDGYADYVKPFRTVEDIHVLGAAIGYLVGLARRIGGHATLVAELAASLIALDRLRIEPASDPRVHIALHGVHGRLVNLEENEELGILWQAAPEDERERWVRDRLLLRVASKARAARFERAWSAFSV